MSIKTKTPLEKYLELPEGYPAELIEGEIVVAPSPGVRHQEIAIDISSKMRFFADERKAGKVLYEIDVHFDEENVLRPDVIFVKNENRAIIGEKWIEGAPDIVVEILSPSSATRDLLVKKDLYESFGVKEYWIIDPENEEVFVYENKGGKFSLICRGKRCSSKILDGFDWGFSENR